MRLEVLVDQQEPLIFPLNKEKIVIGSGENCDIVLETDGISRKHVIIYCGEDDFYVVDQGSTNGTFINEERLVPGKRVEFTSFFPVRMGFNVLLTLLSDEETNDLALSGFNEKAIEKPVEPEPERTRVINRSELRDFTNSGINAHRKKASVRAKRAESALKKSGGASKTKKKDTKESRFHLVSMAAAALLIFTIFFQLTKEEPSYEVPEVANVNTAPQAPESGPEVAAPVEEVIPKVEKEFIKSDEEIAQVRSDFKCTSEVEKLICDSLDLKPPYGATQLRRDIFIFTPMELEPKHLERLKYLYGADKPGPYPIEFYTTYFFSKYTLQIPEEYNDFRIHLYFYDKEDKKLGSVSFYPKGLKEFVSHSPERFVEDFLYGAQMVLGIFKDYFTAHE